MWSSGEKFQEGKKLSQALEIRLDLRYHVTSENKHIYDGKYWRWQTRNPITGSTLQSRTALEMLSLVEFIKLNNTFGKLNEQ